MLISSFYSSFVFTLGVVAVLVALFSIGFSLFGLWQVLRLLTNQDWGAIVGLLVVGLLPFLSFWSVGLPWHSILGIMAAGGVIGAPLALYSCWRYRRLEIQKTIGISLIMILGGEYGTLWLMAMLVMMANAD